MSVADREWAVPCTDAVGRPRHVRVRLAERSRLVLSLPAGEAAALTADEAQALIRAVSAGVYEIRSVGCDVRP